MGNVACIIVVLCYGMLCQLLFMAKQQRIYSEAAIWEHCIIVHKAIKCVCMSCYNYVCCVQGVAEKQLC